ncbi:MAG TPA: basic secretory protein-like protein [Polyangiaceae bacterium]
MTKQLGDRSVWLVALIASAAAGSIACSDDPGLMGGVAGSGGSPATPLGGSAGAPVAGSPSSSGGAGSGVGGRGGSGGAVTNPAGGSGGTTGGSGGTTGGSGSGGAGGSGGTAGGGGGAGGSGGGTVGAFGVVSCQPAFEVVCKPPIEFTNGDPGGRGKVFTDAVPNVEATMKEIACTACSMLYRTPNEMPQNKRPTKIQLVLDEHGGVAQAGGDRIQFDLNYIDGYDGRPADVVRREMMGVLQHETVHLYQNYGNGGTGEGLADLVRARTGYYERNRWSSGGSWRDAYTTSGNFYSWLTGPCAFHSETRAVHDLDLPYKLNKALGNTSGEAAYTAVNDLLQMTFGKSADDLWDEYQDQAF